MQHTCTPLYTHTSTSNTHPHGRSIQGLRELTTFDVAWDGSPVPTRAWCGVVEGLPVYFLEPLQPAAFFWRGRMYGEPDDAERFMFFSRAALEFLVATNRQPDVLHLHDWQSAAVVRESTVPLCCACVYVCCQTARPAGHSLARPSTHLPCFVAVNASRVCAAPGVPASQQNRRRCWCMSTGPGAFSA